NTARISTWEALLAATKTALDAQRLSQGGGLRVLSETVTSPTLAHQIQTLLAEFPTARWHQYEPVGRDTVLAGARLAFGEDVDPQYHLDEAEVILALDADFLFSLPGRVRYARDFTAKRRVQDEHSQMNRLYVVESTPSITGAMADHRLSLRAGEIEHFARAVAQALGLTGGPESQWIAAATHAKWIAALVGDLQHHRGSSLVVAGDQQSPVVHALAHAMNHTLGNISHTVTYTSPAQAKPVAQGGSLCELVQDMETGRVELLLILGGNPVFTAPADLRFAEQLAKVPLRIHCSLYEDETAALCHWHIPEAHSLESWSDA